MKLFEQKEKVMKAITFIIAAITTCFLGACSETRDDINLPFVNDPQVIGTWESVDFVANTGDFVPSQKQFQGELFLKSLTFLENGKTPDEWQTWTQGVLIHKNERTASHYEIREMTGSIFMFLEWKSGDYIKRGMKPEYYVLKKK
jgi:bla regulator protein blaR1